MKPLMFFFAASLSIGYSTAQVPNYVPVQDLVSWWPLNNNLIDSSTNTNDGTGSQYTFQPNRFGEANKACRFANNNSYARFSNLPVNTNGNYTINYWVKLDSYQSSDVILDFHPADACDEYPQVWEGFDSLFVVKCDIVSSKRAIGAKGLFLNKWVMMTQMVKSDSTFIYLDGVLRTKFPYTWNTSTTANLFIANGYNYSMQYITGANVTIDDIGLWTRLLSDCEITALFNSTPALAITGQPSSQNGNAGGSVSFSVTVNNASATYQWQSNIGPGGTFIDVPNAGQYSGVTSSTLTVSSLTAINDNQLFRCIVSGGETGCGNITSSIVSVAVETTGINDHDYYASSILEQNIPNPAGDRTVINYYVPTFKNNASILICDAGGRKVWSGNIAQRGKGQFTLGHQELEQGIYFYSLIIDGFKASTKKMIIIR